FKELVRRLRFDLAFFHWLKRYLPRGLYGRALLILVTPVILAQAVATYVFYDRLWQTVTNRLTFAIAGEIGTIVTRAEEGRPKQITKEANNALTENLDLNVEYYPGKSLPYYLSRGDYTTLLARMLHQALDEKVHRPYALDLRHSSEWIAVHVQMKKGVLTV